MNDTIIIEGSDPIPVRRPANAQELGELVRAAAEKNEGIFPVGGGTHLHVGFAPSKPGTVVALDHFNEVIDYPARDMTITVGAGITIAELQRVLAAENQWLPIDIPGGPRATLGGAIATNRSGPRRLAQGTLRDAVIGISFLTDEGVEVKGGGRVVKNVAGYDLMKLHIGALGTLGVVTQVTLKVKPKPESSALVAFGLNAGGVGPTLERLHASASRPVAVELLNAASLKTLGNTSLPAEDPWVIVCGFEEKRTTVDWQVSTLMNELKSAPVRGVIEFRDAAAEPLWKALNDLAEGMPETWSIKASTLPSQVAVLTSTMGAENSAAIVHAHAGNGIAYAHYPLESAERSSIAIANLGKLLAVANANWMVTRCPPDWKKGLPIFGRDTGERAMMRTVKRTLDPKDVFNSGRT